MKCPFCGAPLSLEDETCPYCGTENPEAKQHISDMKQYKQKFEQTQKEVYSSTRRFTHLSVRMILISALVLLNVMAVFVIANSWNIYQLVSNRQISARADEHAQTMEQFIADARYQELYEYYQKNRLYMYDGFEDYYCITTAANYYSSVFNYVSALIISPEDASWALPSLSSMISGYYSLISGEYFLTEGNYKEEHLAALTDLQAQLELLLKTYCHFTDEDISSLPSLSENGVRSLVERRMNLHAEETKKA